MQKELKTLNEKFISLMKKEKGVSGAWYFGSLSHDKADEFSDIDIVFLIEEDSFFQIDTQLTEMLKDLCSNVLICWPEDFNSDAIKNYGYLLQVEEKLLQYDIFLLNKGKITDFMCQMHYTNLQKKDIIFDKEGAVNALVQEAPSGNLWQDNIHNLIQTYWLHVYMSAKYFGRKDFFKLNGVLRILMDTHTSLLLTAYDQITWGGSANKLAFIPEEKQKHLMKYGCIEDFEQMKANLFSAVSWFCEDIAEIGNSKEAAYSQKTSDLVMEYWQSATGN